MAGMTNDLPISVIITAYDGEPFVAEAIRSVREQSSAPREIILVDDGSHDRTPEIGRSHGVKVLTQPNAGTSAARNAGTRAASAPWVAYLDVDDLWAREKLELQWNALQRSPSTAFSFCEFAEFDDSGIITPKYLAACAEYAGVGGRPLGPACVVAGRERLARQLLLADFILPSSLVVRRDVALGIGGFDEGLRNCEDYDFLLRLLVVTDAVIVETPGLFYRIHSANKSAAWHANLLGQNAIGERAARHPHRYPAGAAAHFAARRIPNINAAAKTLLRSQRYREARETAAGGLREVFSWDGAVTVALGLVLNLWPARAVHSALRARKRRNAADQLREPTYSVPAAPASASDRA